MKRIVLMTLVSLLTLTSLYATEFEWGPATWSIQDGAVFKSIQELKQTGITLTFPNPSGYQLTFLNMISVEYDLYVDDATEPIKSHASAQMSTVVDFSDKNADDFVEGHRYRIVTTKNRLMQANLATYVTDTISTNEDSYTISFTLEGPELVLTMDVEATMALTITDQSWWLTYSEIDTQAIMNALGINEMVEAQAYGLNVNGSYNMALLSPDFGYDVFDGWRDADGEYTVYNGSAGGGIYNLLGHNPYPAVYCIKLNETCDSVFYYFYDWWKEYNPEDPGTGGGTIVTTVLRAPETHYHSTIWDWEWTDDEGNPQVTQYTRMWRCDEGEDYKASYAFIANGKMVRLDCTMHFVSQEQYDEYLTPVNSVKVTETSPITIYGIDGRRKQTLTRGLNLVRQADGTTLKVLVK